MNILNVVRRAALLAPLFVASGSLMLAGGCSQAVVEDPVGTTTSDLSISDCNQFNAQPFGCTESEADEDKRLGAPSVDTCRAYIDTSGDVLSWFAGEQNVASQAQYICIGTSDSINNPWPPQYLDASGQPDCSKYHPSGGCRQSGDPGYNDWVRYCGNTCGGPGHQRSNTKQCHYLQMGTDGSGNKLWSACANRRFLRCFQGDGNGSYFQGPGRNGRLQRIETISPNCFDVNRWVTANEFCYLHNHPQPPGVDPWSPGFSTTRSTNAALRLLDVATSTTDQPAACFADTGFCSVDGPQSCDSSPDAGPPDDSGPASDGGGAPPVDATTSVDAVAATQPGAP